MGNSSFLDSSSIDVDLEGIRRRRIAEERTTSIRKKKKKRRRRTEDQIRKEEEEEHMYVKNGGTRVPCGFLFPF